MQDAVTRSVSRSPHSEMCQRSGGLALKLSRNAVWTSTVWCHDVIRSPDLIDQLVAFRPAGSGMKIKQQILLVEDTADVFA